MPVDGRKNNQKIEIHPGELIFLQESPVESLNLLHEGTVGLEIQLPDGRSTPIANLSGQNLTPGVHALTLGQPYPYSIRAKSTCILSTYPMSTAGFKKMLPTKLSLAVMAGKSLNLEISNITKKISSIYSLCGGVERFTDNLSALYYVANPTAFPDIVPGKPIPADNPNVIDPILRLSRENIANFLEKGGMLPETLSLKFLNDDHAELFFKEYPESFELEDPDLNYIRKIWNLEGRILQAILEKDTGLINYPVEKFSESVKGLLNLAQSETHRLDDLMSLFLQGDQCILEKYLLIIDLFSTGYSQSNAASLSSVTEEIAQKALLFRGLYKDTTGLDYTKITSNFSSFQEKSKKIAAQAKPESGAATSDLALEETQTGTPIEVIRKELANSPSVIFNFAGTPPETIKEFSSLMLKLKSLNNPLDGDPDVRKLRKNITKIYWDTYTSSFIKYMDKGKQAPRPVEMMFRWGYFDDSLLEDSQLKFLYDYEEKHRPDPNIPVHFGMEWLSKIYTKELPNSMDELGQTFFEKVKVDLKDPNIKKESDLPPNIDSGVNRLKFEVASMYETNVRLTSGSIATHFPILTRWHISSPLEKCVMTKKNLEEIIKEILKIDYTVFNREVIYKNEELGIRNEFVNVSVAPDFIVVPSIGGRVMMWQDLSVFRGSGSKESRGRIVLPNFIIGDPKTLVLEALAAFRWELVKNILGPDWNNVGISSITADYTDYVQFYKKNKDLSIEVKEKLAAEFKRFRTDRDKFANDYLLWIKYESEGVPRLNRVVRSVFYKHVPFQKEIRDKLCTQPAYAEIHNRFKNIRGRHYREHEARYKKYMNEAGQLPDILQRNLEFYDV